MESYHLSQYSLSYSSIHLALFHNVTNSAELRKRLVAASTMEGLEGDRERDRLDYAFVEADMIVSRQQLLAALFPTLQAASTSALKTKTPHSEVLLCLHPVPNPQINDALRKFGISPSTKRLILIRIGTPTGPTPSSSSAENNDLAGDETFDARKERYEQELVDQMAEVVEGEMVSLDRLGEEADWKSLKKLYKLNEMNLPQNAPSSPEERSLMEDVIASTVATKSVAGN